MWLQGRWYANVPAHDGGVALTLRRRFVDGTYYETIVAPGLLCADQGTFLLNTDGVRFSPARVVGVTGCGLRTAHVEPIVLGGGGDRVRACRRRHHLAAHPAVARLFPRPGSAHWKSRRGHLADRLVGNRRGRSTLPWLARRATVEA